MSDDALFELVSVVADAQSHRGNPVPLVRRVVALARREAQRSELAALVRWSTLPGIPGEMFRSAVDAYCERWAGEAGELPECVVLRAVEGW